MAVGSIPGVPPEQTAEALGVPVGEGRCRGCHRRIIWAETPGGGRVPLDPTPATYQLWPSEDGSGFVAHRSCALVSHFATCPYARDFSGSSRRARSG